MLVASVVVAGSAPLRSAEPAVTTLDGLRVSLFVQPAPPASAKAADAPVGSLHVVVSIANTGKAAVDVATPLNFRSMAPPRTDDHGVARAWQQSQERVPPRTSPDAAGRPLIWLKLERMSDALPYAHGFAPTRTGDRIVLPANAPSSSLYLEYLMDEACVAGDEGEWVLSAWCGDACVARRSYDLRSIRHSTSTSNDARPPLRQE